MKLRPHVEKILTWCLFAALTLLMLFWILLAPQLGMDLFMRGLYAYLLFAFVLVAMQAFYQHAMEHKLLPLYQAMNLMLFTITFFPFVGLSILFVSFFLLDFTLDSIRLGLSLSICILTQIGLVLAHLSLSRLVYQLNNMDKWLTARAMRADRRHQSIRQEVLNRMYKTSGAGQHPKEAEGAEAEPEATIHLRKEDALASAPTPMSERFSRWDRESSAEETQKAPQKPLGKMRYQNPVNTRSFQLTILAVEE